MPNYLVGEMGWHRLATKTLEDYDWVGNDYLKTLIDTMINKDYWTKGIGLTGWVGVGKTHILISLYKERLWKAVFEGCPVPGFIPFYDLVDTWQMRDGKTIVNEMIKSRELWFIDDLWSNRSGEVERDILKYLVFQCYDTGKILSFTSNLDIDSWSGVDERVIDRIKEMCILTVVSGKSKREFI